MKRILFTLAISISVVFAHSTFATTASPCESTSEPISQNTILEISNIYPNPQDGETEWIQIKNSGKSAADLSFYTIEDTTEKPWQLSGNLSANTEIKIDGFPFQLNNGGDTVTLKDLDGNEIDVFSYSASTQGEILSKNFTQEAESTGNKPSMPTLWPEFSEAMPNPEGTDTTDEWIELYNPFPNSINLAGLKLDDSDGGSKPYELIGTMEGESYSIIWVEDSRISLNNSSDHIRLLNSSDEILWDIQYESAKEAYSYANFGTYYDWTASSTPGLANQMSESSADSSEYFDGDLSEDIEITEIFPNPKGPDNEKEWIEISNKGSAPVNLGNWILQDSEGGSKRYKIPDNIELSPNESIIFYRNDSGITLNNSSETIQLLDFTGEIMDEITYDASVEDMSYAKIEIEEVSSEQASLSGLANKMFSTWEWVIPSPGKNNPSWKQLKGEIIDFDGTFLTLFDGITNWTVKTDTKATNSLMLKSGNTILARLAMTNGVYTLMHSELIETKEPDAKVAKFHWEWPAMFAFGIGYASYEFRKKRKLNLGTYGTN